MHWRKDLTIETNFFEDGIEGIPDAILINSGQVEPHLKTGLSDDYDSYARNSTQIIERVLSNRLASNFVECWETLKQAALPPMAYRSHHRTSNSSLLSNVRAVEQQIIHPLRHHREEMVPINDQLLSSNVEWLQTQHWKHHVNTQLAEHHIQRAKLLKEIVDKLKKGKIQSQKTDEKIQKLSQNQYILTQIKNLEHVTQQIQYERMIEKSNYQNQHYSQQNRYDYRQEEHMRTEEDTLLEEQMWKELTLLKQQLENLRLDNEMILTQQTTRQMNLKQLQKTKDQLQRTYESLKLQTQIRSQNGSIQNMSKTKSQQFRQNYEREMTLLQERIKNMEQREQLTRQQFMRQLALRQELANEALKKQKAMMQEFIESQRHRQQFFKEKIEKEAQLRLSLEQEEQIKQQFLKQHTAKEQQLRNQIKREQELREEAIRTCNQKQIQFRSNNLQHYSQIQQQLRQQIIEEYRQRQQHIRKQTAQLEQMSHALAEEKIRQKQIAVLEQNRIEEMIKKIPSPRSQQLHITPEMNFRVSPNKNMKTNQGQSLQAKRQLQMQASPDKIRMNVPPQAQKKHQRFQSQQLEIYEQGSVTFKPEKSYLSEEIQTERQDDSVTLAHQLQEPNFMNIYPGDRLGDKQSINLLESHLRSLIRPQGQVHNQFQNQQTRMTEPVSFAQYMANRQQISEPVESAVIRIPPPERFFPTRYEDYNQKSQSKVMTDRQVNDLNETKKTINISFRHDSHNSTSFVSPNKSTTALLTERTQVVSPQPEHSQHSTLYNQSYGYGYGYGYETTRTTKQTRDAHINWHFNQKNSKDADSQTQIQLTARPHQSALYGSNISARMLKWPKPEQKDKREDCCNNCCEFS